MKTMTDLLNDELDSIMAHCMEVCDSDSFDDVALVGSPDLHDSHVLAWHGDLSTDMDDDELTGPEWSWAIRHQARNGSASLDRVHNSHVLKHAWMNKDRNWWKTW